MIELKQIPAKVAAKQVLKGQEIVRLETERKLLTDTVKILIVTDLGERRLAHHNNLILNRMFFN